MTRDTISTRAAVAVGLLLTATLAACSHDGRQMRPPRPDQSQSIIETTEAPGPQLDGFDATLETTTPVPLLTLSLPWTEGGPIPTDYTCTGVDVSPPLTWSGVPSDAVSLAIVVSDDDATTGDGRAFVHWIVANIPPSVSAVPSQGSIAGAIEAANDFSTPTSPRVGWGGPCPPASATHTYSFEIRALDRLLDLADGTPAADLVAAIDAATVATARGTATATG